MLTEYVNQAAEANMASILGGSGKSILAKFSEEIGKIITSESIEKALVDELVEREAEKRVKALVVCYDNLLKMKNDLNKIDRPDDIKYDKDKKPVQEFYTKSRLDEIDKIKQKIEKHEKAIVKGLEGEMKDVYELAQQSSGKDKKDSGSGGGKSSEASDTETT
jgi:hypothetical protein